VLRENMQMIPPSIFSFKTNRNPRQRHVVPFKIRHVAIIYIFNFKAFFFFKKIIFGVTELPLLGHMGVAKPPPWPMGVIWHPQGQNGKPKNLRVLS